MVAQWSPWVFECKEHKIRIESTTKRLVDTNAESHWQLYPACRPPQTVEVE